MNCEQCNEQLLPYEEGLLDDAAAAVVKAHLAGCPTCHSDWLATQQLQDRLLAAANVSIDKSLDVSVMAQIQQLQIVEMRRLKMRRRLRIFGFSGIAAALLLGLTLAVLQNGPQTVSAAEMLSKAVQAATDLKTVYLKCRMRTLPNDNFSYLDLEHGFVDVELWKQYDPIMKWKIQKPGRVAAMNGRQTVMLIGGRKGIKLEQPAKMAFDTDWLHRLAAVDEVLMRELTAATSSGNNFKVTNEDVGDDIKQHRTIVEIGTNRKLGAYLANKFLSTSDTRRVYTFQRDTGRLENAKYYCHSDDGDVLVLEIIELKVNVDWEESTFELDVPTNVSWFREPQRLPDNGQYEKLTPAEAAQAFFEACGRNDWEEVAKFTTVDFSASSRKSLGGLEVITLGKPFQAWPYVGWFVPYEIRLNDGQVRKHNLALRKDNPAKRFVVDGGL